MSEQIALALIDGKVSQIASTDTIRGASGGSAYQKYFIASAETYSIPQYFSSVVTGPLDIDGVIVLDGRLEVL
jgi:hypothetical protein